MFVFLLTSWNRRMNCTTDWDSVWSFVFDGWLETGKCKRLGSLFHEIKKVTEKSLQTCRNGIIEKIRTACFLWNTKFFSELFSDENMWEDLEWKFCFRGCKKNMMKKQTGKEIKS